MTLSSVNYKSYKAKISATTAYMFYLLYNEFLVFSDWETNACVIRLIEQLSTIVTGFI